MTFIFVSFSIVFSVIGFSSCIAASMEMPQKKISAEQKSSAEAVVDKDKVEKKVLTLEETQQYALRLAKDWHNFKSFYYDLVPEGGIVENLNEVVDEISDIVGLMTLYTTYIEGHYKGMLKTFSAADEKILNKLKISGFSAETKSMALQARRSEEFFAKLLDFYKPTVVASRLNEMRKKELLSKGSDPKVLNAAMHNNLIPFFTPFDHKLMVEYKGLWGTAHALWDRYYEATKELNIQVNELAKTQSANNK